MIRTLRRSALSAAGTGIGEKRSPSVQGRELAKWKSVAVESHTSGVVSKESFLAAGPVGGFWGGLNLTWRNPGLGTGQKNLRSGRASLSLGGPPLSSDFSDPRLEWQ